MGIALGLLGSLLIGCGDYFGRFSTRRSNALSTTTIALCAGVATSGLFSVILGGSYVPADVTYGALSGLFIGVALALLYHAMAISSAALASPVVAAGTALIPLAWATARGSRPDGIVLLGVGLALIGIVIITISPDLRGRLLAGFGYAVAAALGFGIALTLAGQTTVESGVWSAFAQRVVALVAVAGLTRARSRPLAVPGALVTVTLLSGALGAGGLMAYIAGTQRGDLATVAVAASLYPVVTTVLAVAFDDDTLRWWQVLGIAVVLAGIAAMTVG